VIFLSFSDGKDIGYIARIEDKRAEPLLLWVCRKITCENGAKRFSLDE
jgi:hypothetical protein